MPAGHRTEGLHLKSRWRCFRGLIGRRKNAKNPASTTPIVSSVVATGRLMNRAAEFTLAGLQSGLIAAEAAADQVAEATQHRVTRLSFP